MPIDRLLRMVLLAAALCFASPGSAFAQNPCAAANGNDPLLLGQSESGLGGTGRDGGDESGIGGTGLSGGDDSGIGGSGLSGDDSGIHGSGYAAAEESGLGGTGRDGGDESGIGGTGIYGAITGFGSICVNGLRIHYDADTPVRFDGEPASADALETGQVVAVSARGEVDELDALSIEVHTAITGTVEAIDFEDSSLQVMGVRVLLGEEGFEELAEESIEAGRRVSVSGLWRNDGTLEASWIALASDRKADQVAGVAHALASGRFEVQGVEVASASDLAEGRLVRVAGRFDATRRQLRAQRISTSSMFAARVERLSIEGYLRERPDDGRLYLPGIEVDRRSFERAVDLPDKAERFRITGRRDALGRLQVERVDRIERVQALRDLVRARHPGFDKPAKLRRKNKIAKPEDRPQRPRAARPLERPPRPPRIDRPEKPDRPAVIDAVIRRLRDRVNR